MPKPASDPTVPATIASLLDKGDGVLTKRANVWTYPGAPNDRSGTNLVLPLEFVSEAAVQEALKKGEVVPRATDTMGVVVSIGRPATEGAPVRVINMMMAGSVEAATELPLNSRPTHDAGRNDKSVDVAKAQTVVEAGKVQTPVVASATGAAPLAAGPVIAPTALKS
ncbi:MAG: hypothetical protein ACRYGP_28305 [Janthinobacterium lividum]